MHQIQPRLFIRELSGPVEQLGLPSVCREAAQSMDLRIDRKILVHESHPSGAIDQRPAEGAARLEADKHNMIFIAPQTVFQVMPDTSAGAHTAPRNNDRTAGNFI